MAWRIELSKLAQKNLDALDPQVARRILRFLYERIAPLENPRAIGEAPKGQAFGVFWKYRVGDYRIIAGFEDEIARVLVVRVGIVGRFIDLDDAGVGLKTALAPALPFV